MRKLIEKIRYWLVPTVFLECKSTPCPYTIGDTIVKRGYAFKITKIIDGHTDSYVIMGKPIDSNWKPRK